MEPSRRRWTRLLALLALPLVIVLAVVLGVLAALAFYVRALVVAVVHPFRRREQAQPEAQSLAGPHVPAASRIVPGEPGTSAP